MYLYIAVAAYFLNSVSVLIDKFLLAKIGNPLVYVFYISLFSLFLLLFLPFTQTPTLSVLFISSLSTLVWTAGIYLMFKALKEGQATRVIPMIGALVPSVLIIIEAKTGSIELNQIWAVGFFVAALLLLTWHNLKGKLVLQELLFEVGAAVMLAFSYLLIKEAYSQGDFLSVLTYSRLVLLPFILVTSFYIKGHLKLRSKNGLLFLIGQSAGGGAQLLIFYAISLASPALINAIAGIQYLFLFLLGLTLSIKIPIFKEQFGVGKILGILLIAAGLYLLQPPPQDMKLGVTYSPRYAKSLGLDPKETFVRMVDDLRVKRVRLPIYWDEVEIKQGEYNFSEVDFYLEQSQKKGVEVILVIGYRQPRWPECFPPNWAKKLSRKKQNQAILELINREVTHFKKFDAVKIWQVENEPFLKFGICDPIDRLTTERVKQEIANVKKLDQRPVLITDSGELSTWFKTYNLGDIFGTTLYRTVLTPFGRFSYPLPPSFYRLKGQLATLLTGSKNQLIISELQTEPWPINAVYPEGQITKNVEFAKQTGANTAYLWGVEWWYQMDKKGDHSFLKEAEKLF